MAVRAARVVWVVLLIGTACLAGAASGRAQAAAEAGAVASAKSAGGGAAAKTLGKSVGSALGGLGGKLDDATKPGVPAASPNVTQVMPAGDPAERNGGQPGIDRVVGPPPEIHFDVVSFQRCTVAGSSEVELPADGDSVASHCQPLSRLIRFAYVSDSSVNGAPSWVQTDLYDFAASVAQEDVATWQKLGLSARKATVQRLLAHELKLRVRVETATEPGKAQAAGLVVEHIERPLAD